MEKIFSNKIFYAIVLGLVIIGFSYAISRPKIEPSAKKNTSAGNETQDKTINLADLVQKDSDGDGIPDWEETLWGTDPENPDTYGRGLGDLAEIEKMRKTTAGTGTSGQNKPSSDTEIFSRQLFSSLVALKQSGNLSETTLDNLSSDVTENIRLSAAEKTYYTLSDLKIVGTASSSLQKYRLDMAGVAKKYAGAGLGDELPALVEAVGRNNPDKLSVVSAKIPIYQKLLGENLDLSVPNVLSLDHLDVVNSYRNIIESLGQAEKIWSDPLVGLIEVTRYRNATSQLLIALGNIELYYAPRDTIKGTITPQTTK